MADPGFSPEVHRGSMLYFSLRDERLMRASSGIQNVKASKALSCFTLVQFENDNEGYRGIFTN